MILNIFLARESPPAKRRWNQKEPPVNILTVKLLLSTFVFWIAARLYLLPACTRASRATCSTDPAALRCHLG
jgi:hypothetical protein